MSADEGATAFKPFTPRRSSRCNKLEMSLKEEDLWKTLNNSNKIQRTPSRLSRLLNSDTAVKRCPLDSPPKGSSSEENSKNSKKRNKKSKKQKAKANLKRKDAKKLESQRNSSNESQEISDVVCATAESVSGASSNETNLTEIKVETKEQSMDADVETDEMANENAEETSKKLEAVESGYESSKIKDEVLSMQSPDLTSSKTDDFINLVTPDMPNKNTSEVVVQSSPEEGNYTNSNQNSQECTTEEIKDGTYDLAENTIPVMELKQEAAKVETPKETVANQVTGCGPRFSSTPARKSVNDRKGTPFKPIKEDSIKKAIATNVAYPSRMKVAAAILSSPVVTPVSSKGITKTPLKSALRRSRRSFSCDSAVLNTTTKRAVVFNSPLNTTINIDEVDLLMKSKKKITYNGEAGGNDRVTMRRKRSMSVAETESEKEFVKDLLPIGDDAGSTKKLNRAPTPASRVKLPNFAAIHKQQFEKMESISDHVARKTERLKVLSSSKSKPDWNSSTTKAKDTHFAKTKEENFSGKKDVLNSSLKKDVKRLNGAAKPISSQPRARQRIELTNIKVSKKPLRGAVKSILQENTNMNRSVKASVVKALKKSVRDTTIAQKAGENLVDRQKEHMSMYKNSSFANTTILQEDRKERKDYIAGVRSNRRFMLQMQHRDRMYK